MDLCFHVLVIKVQIISWGIFKIWRAISGVVWLSADVIDDGFERCDTNEWMRRIRLAIEPIRALTRVSRPSKLGIKYSENVINKITLSFEPRI
jgi:hypothetical protein